MSKEKIIALRTVLNTSGIQRTNNALYQCIGAVLDELIAIVPSSKGTGTGTGEFPLHAPTHSNGGTDPVDVKNLAGYPGGTENFLRADHTFAPPPGGTIPGPHHLTHEPGGGDAMAVDAAASIGSLRTLGFGPDQATSGNDPRLSDARTPLPHAPTHKNGGSDPLDIKQLPGYPGNSTLFLNGIGVFATPPDLGMDLDYLGGYAVGTYNDGDIVIGSDGVAYMCVKDGTTTPPEPWPGLGVKPHHVTHEPGGNDEILNINAIRITSGLVNQARLGSGAVGAGGKYLADDQTWKAIAFPPQIDTTPIGAMLMWGSNTPPTNYVMCWGQELSRATYAVLFSIIGTAYGVGNGSTTFQVPNFVGRFPLGIAASGPLNALGAYGGSLDHTHTLAIDANGYHAHYGPLHQHSTDVHSHGAGSYAVNSHNHGGIVGGDTNAAGDHAHGFDAETAGPTGSFQNADAGNSFTSATPAHSHHVSGPTSNAGTHAHHYEAGIPSDAPGVNGNSSNSGGGLTSVSGNGVTSAEGQHSHTGIANGANPPYMTVNWIIKVV